MAHWTRFHRYTYLDTMFGVCYTICCHGRMVADLLRDKVCLTSIVLPGAKEKLAQERIQRFLFASQLVVP